MLFFSWFTLQLDKFQTEPRPETSLKFSSTGKFSLQFSERKLLLVVIDLFLTNSALIISLDQGFNNVNKLEQFWSKLPWFILLSGYWLISAYIFKAYDLRRAAQAYRSAQMTSGAALMAVIIYYLTPFLSSPLPSSRISFFIFPFLMVSTLAAWRFLYAVILTKPGFQQKAIIIGAGWAGQTLAHAIIQKDAQTGQFQRSAGYHLIGFIDDDTDKQEFNLENFRVLGSRNDLEHLNNILRPDEIVLAITHSNSIHPELLKAILRCREAGTSITTMATVYERLTNRLPLEHTEHAISMVLPLTNRATHRIYLGIQKLFDLVIGLFGCLLLLLFIPFVWLLNHFNSPGPLFYQQERVGRGGKTFLITKFRSMVVDAEKLSGAVWASNKDPRITKIGGFLRRTRLDEFPQFWNILKGEMSLIGPRPERPCFVEQLSNKMPYYRVRHAIKPGLTGWAQVEYRYTSTLDDSLIKLQYDLYYIKHQNLLLDFAIILKTVGVVVGFKGR